MAKLVNFTALIGLAAVLLTAACATRGDVSPEEAARNRARLAAIARLPHCAEAQTLTGARTGHIPECRLTAGASGPHLVITSDPVQYEMLGPSGFVSVSVTSRRGQAIGDFAEVTYGHYGYPQLRDVNGDRRQDIVIPLTADTENVTYSLWLQQENGDFSYAGQITGSQISWASRGMIAAVSRAGMSAWTVGYFSVEAGKLREAALVKAEGSDPPKRGGRCEIVRIAPGAEPGHFCAAG